MLNSFLKKTIKRTIRHLMNLFNFWKSAIGSMSIPSLNTGFLIIHAIRFSRKSMWIRSDSPFTKWMKRENSTPLRRQPDLTIASVPTAQLKSRPPNHSAPSPFAPSTTSINRTLLITGTRCVRCKETWVRTTVKKCATNHSQWIFLQRQVTPVHTTLCSEKPVTSASRT